MAMIILDDYFRAKYKVHEHFGYEEGWTDIPLNDCTSSDWALFENEDGSGEVYFGVKEDIISYLKGEEMSEPTKTLRCYSNVIYARRDLKKFVYVSGEFTMISCDTQTDGNKFLCVFTNSRKFETDALDD